MQMSHYPLRLLHRAALLPDRGWQWLTRAVVIVLAPDLDSLPGPDSLPDQDRLPSQSASDEGPTSPHWPGSRAKESWSIVGASRNLIWFVIRWSWLILKGLAYSYVILLILLLVWQCAFVNWPMPNGDVQLYHKYASAFWSVQHRFQSLPAEYPPLAVFVFSLTLLPELPRVPTTGGLSNGSSVVEVLSRDAGFAAWMGLIVLLTFAVCWRLSNQRRAWACLAYLCIGGVGVLLTRFDIVPALVVLLAFGCARRRWFHLAYLLLAVGTGLKIYPIFLVPVFAAYQWRLVRVRETRDPRADETLGGGARSSRAGHSGGMVGATLAVGSGVGIFVAFIVGVILLGNAWDPKNGALTSLTYASTRPLQVESLPASLLWFISAFGPTATAKFSYFSFNLVGPADGILIPLTYIGLVVGCTLTYWRVLAGKLSFERGTIAVIAIAILTGKVFSTQYIVWLMPLVAVVEGFDWPWLLMCLLTAWDYPILYSIFGPTMMRQYDPLLLGVIAARNILLLVATARLFRRPLTAGVPKRDTLAIAGPSHSYGTIGAPLAATATPAAKGRN